MSMVTRASALVGELARVPAALQLGSLVFALLLRSPLLGVYAIASIASHGVNAALKAASRACFGNRSWSRRPLGAQACGPFGEDYGMPSGHAQSVGLLAGFFTLYLLLRRDSPPAPSSRGKGGEAAHTAFLVALVWALAFAVSAQRVSSCHTAAQVAAGFGVGVTLGAGAWVVYARCRLVIRK